MRGLLRVILVALPASLSMLFASAHDVQAVVTVDIYLMPGADNPGGISTVRLTCGFHGACDNVYPDPNGGLDFVEEDGVSELGEPAHWRVKAYDGVSSSTIVVGKMFRHGVTSGTYCDYSYAYMYKPDGVTNTGYIAYFHVNPYSDYWRNVYGKTYPGYQNTNTMGTLTSDANEMPYCLWTGPHVHQDLDFNVGQINWWYRGGYPTEQQCYGCLQQKAIWVDFQAAYQYYR